MYKGYIQPWKVQAYTMTDKHPHKRKVLLDLLGKMEHNLSRQYTHKKQLTIKRLVHPLLKKMPREKQTITN